MSPRVAEQAAAMLDRFEGLRTALLAIPERSDPLFSLAARAQGLAQDLAFVLGAEDDGHVCFVETRGRGVFLRATPIDVSARLKELLFDQVRAAVLTSATLAVDGGFDYLKSRLGLEPTDELLLASPFDYEEQAILYVPRRMPEPSSPRFVDRAADEIVRILEVSRGRAFVLFTSYANMNAVAERIAGARGVSAAHAGGGAQAGAPGDVPAHAGRGPARDLVLLAGRGRRGRAALVRDHRQAAVRLARRSGGAGAHRAPPQPGRAIPSRSTRCRWRS